MRPFARRILAALLLALSVAWAAPAVAQEMFAAPVVEEVELPPPPPPEGWQTVHGAFLRVHGPPEAYRTLLRLARHGSDALPRLAEELGVPIGDTIHVYLTESDARFRELQPGTPPTWADATAYPGRGIVFLRAPGVRGGTAKPLEQVFDHELVHILLGRAFAPRIPPQWLQEGVAQVKAGEYSPETTRDLARGMLAGELLSLTELSRGFPSDPLEARLAYAQSADFVSWLQAEHGTEALGVLIREMAAGGTVNAGVLKATGELLEDVDRRWRAGLTDSQLSLTPLLDVNSWLAITGVLLLIGGVLRRRRFHRRLEEMEEEERLLEELIVQTRARRGGEGAGGLGMDLADPWVH